MIHHSLNEIYTRPTMGRRYEVWFLKVILADGGGAWWFRYLLMNLGRKVGCESWPDAGPGLGHVVPNKCGA
jgi:hypothetical protein